jgi:hypothetical protein
MIALLAGASTGLSSVALAQSATNLDTSRAYGADLVSNASNYRSTLQDGGSSVEWGGQIQFRYIWNSRDDDALEDDDAIGFQTRRTKLWAKGEIAENWSIEVVAAAHRDGGLFELQNAFVRYQINEQADLQWGQFKLPFMRQESVSSARQLTVERSIMNETFNQDYSQGIQYSNTGDQFRFAAAFSDGFVPTTINSDFTSGAEADWAITGRGEFMWNGEWSSFNDFTSPQGSAFAGMFGFAGHWQSGGDTFATGDMDVWSITGDLSLEGDGWNVFADAMWRNTDPAGGTDTDDWGVGVQGGWYLNADWELVGRWSLVVPDGDRVGDDEFNEFALGMNYYVFGGGNHSAKFSFDVTYFTDDTASSEIVPTGTGTGLLPSGDDNQWLVRLQFQALF